MAAPSSLQCTHLSGVEPRRACSRAKGDPAGWQGFRHDDPRGFEGAAHPGDKLDGASRQQAAKLNFGEAARSKLGPRRILKQRRPHLLRVYGFKQCSPTHHEKP
jgi:hypothetical protein